MKHGSSAKNTSDFDPNTFLSTIGKGRDMVSFGKKDTIFAQGDSTDGLFFIQRGKVQLSVVSDEGKEATLGILREGDFFGEGRPIRWGYAAFDYVGGGIKLLSNAHNGGTRAEPFPQREVSSIGILSGP